MKRTVLYLAFAFAMLCGTALAGDQDFTLVNRTGLSIIELYVSPSDTDSWEEDVLGVDVLGEGERCNVSFHRDEDSCIWDLMIVDEDEDEIHWTGLDLCEVSVVTLFWEDGRAWAEVR